MFYSLTNFCLSSCRNTDWFYISAHRLAGAPADFTRGQYDWPYRCVDEEEEETVSVINGTMSSSNLLSPDADADASVQQGRV